MNKQQQLDILISSQEEMVGKKALTPRGEGYLDGLKQARKMIYGYKGLEDLTEKELNLLKKKYTKQLCKVGTTREYDIIQKEINCIDEQLNILIK